MFEHILFATDFSPHAEVAKKVAIELARRDGKRLWVLTVLEPIEEPLTLADEPPVVQPEKWERVLEKEEETLEREEERRLAQDVAEITAAGVTVTRMVREGDPDKEIVAAARELGADLVIMGSHSRRSIWDVVLGNTAEKVAKSAPCPVLIVSHQPPHTNEAMQRILLATDFSPHSDVVQKVAVSLAKGEGQTLGVLTVLDPGEVEAAANQDAEWVIASAQIYGVQTQKLIRHGRPAEEIVQAARDMRADVIVMGSHGQRSIWEVLLGGTAEGVAKSAPCPVLIVSHRLSPESETGEARGRRTEE